MKILSNLIQKSKASKKHLWLLNRLMRYIVPFNKPHGFSVAKITDDYVQTFASYRKKNFNHVRGIHACALATVGELAAGLSLMSHFSPLEYRLIMSNITIDYHYQAKKNVIATATFSKNEKTAVLEALLKEGKILQTILTEIKDEENQSIATVKSTWQIKPWKAVKTKV
ncbi:MAG: YiiD C-terminal domain-containing protein [Coxiellaceae bacterium]|nr:YiiD C-terminal domain-containing protein [Coxiellaceae bacterium]